MTHHLSLSLAHAGPSTISRARAKELVQNTPPPSWYSVQTPGDEENDRNFEGGWWGTMAKDEAYTAGLPAVPMMADPTTPRRARIPSKKKSPIQEKRPQANGSKEKTPPLDPPKPVRLESLIHRNVDKLHEARRVMSQIHEFQRLEAEDGILPDIAAVEARERARAKEERAERKRQREEELVESQKRRKLGYEVGGKEASLALKRATAGMLAHAGFEG